MVQRDNETLRVTARVEPYGSPLKRAARLRVVVERGTVDGGHTTRHLKSLRIDPPPGLRVNVAGFPRCLWSTAFLAAPCPASTRVGAGNATIDARPEIAQPLQVPLTAYNGTIDLDVNNQRRDQPLPGLIVRALPGVLSLDLVNLGSLLYEQSLSAEGSNFEIVRLDLTLGGRTRRGIPYVQRPRTCPRSGRWRFVAVERFYDGPSLRATHDVRCRRP